MFGTRLLLIVSGTVLGAALSLGVWETWRVAFPPAAPLDAAARTQLRDRLDRDPHAIFMFDDVISYRYKPSFQGVRTRALHLKNRPAIDYPHLTNSLGLLGSDEVSTDPNRARLLLLGDSVTYGTWVDAHAIFAARLQELAGAACQVSVGACEGWSTRQEIGYFDRYLRGINWQGIVLVFCLNDLVDFEWKYKSSEGFTLAEEMTAVGTTLDVTNQTVDGLKLAALRFGFREHLATLPLASQNNTTLWAWDDGKWRSFFARTLLPFVQRSDLPPLAIVVVPSLSQMQALIDHGSPETILFPQHQMQAFCAEHGVRYIDLVDALAGRTATELRTLYLDDLHFSEAGHALIGDYLWARLAPMTRPAMQTRHQS